MNRPSPAQLTTWRVEQEELRKRVIHSPPESFHFPPRKKPFLIAGADISFSTADETEAVVTLTIHSYPSLKLCYSRSKRIKMTVPYEPGYLAFRETPAIVDMVHKIPHGIVPDVLLVDGNGWLHERRAGLACQVGVELGMVCIGVSKTFYNIDDLQEKDVRQMVENMSKRSQSYVVESSGEKLCVALLTGNAKKKPIYVSVGHMIDLETAAKVVKGCCTYRIPEPIRSADQHSRIALRTDKLVEVFDEDGLLCRE
eukprot:Plantae.Rhodophyta-Hildenbrandia_rubra.ctg30896.p1 GENE.Plantae.Rhodophyta-Hildenbrandia_rubra.ctg30896~~Plantae.Rhodophyta-Hildenbrandia_rubra.ctg30896.p1  ORF type:complete len:255 (+),score=35.08 Plantae.Rhodophyta-Hildenbrandia_rubra.ctg30896:151-915(+)